MITNKPLRVMWCLCAQVVNKLLNLNRRSTPVVLSVMLAAWKEKGKYVSFFFLETVSSSTE